MATKNTKTETNVEDLKETKNEETTEIVVEQDGKLRKILKWGLTGLAVVATGVVSFLLGRNMRDDGDDEDNEQKESTEE